MKKQNKEVVALGLGLIIAAVAMEVYDRYKMRRFLLRALESDVDRLFIRVVTLEKKVKKVLAENDGNLQA